MATVHCSGGTGGECDSGRGIAFGERLWLVTRAHHHRSRPDCHQAEHDYRPSNYHNAKLDHSRSRPNRHYCSYQDEHDYVHQSAVADIGPTVRYPQSRSPSRAKNLGPSDRA